MTEKKTNPNGEALYKALLAHEGETLTFAELAHEAGVAPQTGYLTAMKKVAKDNGKAVVKVDDAFELVQKIETVHPLGLVVTAERKVKVAGYRLA